MATIAGVLPVEQTLAARVAIRPDRVALWKVNSWVRFEDVRSLKFQPAGLPPAGHRLLRYPV